MKFETPLLTLALLHAPLFAVQEDAVQAPAQELKVLTPLVGSWEGSGTARPAPGEDVAMNWTATIDAEWILDGHALREVTVVNFGADMPPISMDTLYIFDREAKSLAQYSVSSMGGLDVAELVHSPEPGTIVVANAMMIDGRATLDRFIMRFRGEGMSFVIERAQDSGKPFDHVSGTFTRRKEGARAIGAIAQKAEGLAQPLLALSPMVGTFDLTGSYVPAPGVPAMKIKGVDTMTPTLSGHGLAIDSSGTADGSPFVYKGHSIIAWNEAEGAFHQAWADNMGMGGHGPLYKVGEGHFVAVRSGHENGTPYSDRTELRCTDGKLASSRTERMSAALPATVVFEAKYSPKK